MVPVVLRNTVLEKVASSPGQKSTYHLINASENKFKVVMNGDSPSTPSEMNFAHIDSVSKAGSEMVLDNSWPKYR